MKITFEFDAYEIPYLVHHARQTIAGFLLGQEEISIHQQGQAPGVQVPVQVDPNFPDAEALANWLFQQQAAEAQQQAQQAQKPLPTMPEAPPKPVLAPLPERKPVPANLAQWISEWITYGAQKDTAGNAYSEALMYRFINHPEWAEWCLNNGGLLGAAQASGLPLKSILQGPDAAHWTSPERPEVLIEDVITAAISVAGAYPWIPKATAYALSGLIKDK